MIRLFAILALLCFVLALFHAHVADLDLVVLGLVFVAAHLVFAWTPWRRG